MYGPARDMRVSIFKEEKCGDLMQRAAGGDGGSSATTYYLHLPFTYRRIRAPYPTVARVRAEKGTRIAETKRGRDVYTYLCTHGN